MKSYQTVVYMLFTCWTIAVFTFGIFSFRCIQKNSSFILRSYLVISSPFLSFSGSMETQDGKTFHDNGSQMIPNGVVKRLGKTRWEEACDKLQKIAKYNVKRGMIASYFLLNPWRHGTWDLNRDVRNFFLSCKNECMWSRNFFNIFRGCELARLSEF